MVSSRKMGIACLLYRLLINVLALITGGGRQKWLNDTLSVWFLHGFVRVFCRGGKANQHALGFRLPENGFAGKMRVFVFQAAFALSIYGSLKSCFECNHEY